MPHPPEADPLVPRDQQLRELVELLVVAALDIDVDDGQAGRTELRREGLAELRRDAPDLAEAGRGEAAAVAEDLPDLLVFPRGHLLEHVELPDDVVDAEHRPPQQPQRRSELAALDQAGRLLDLVPGKLQPELGSLVDGLEEELVAVGPLALALLQRQQLLRAQVALVVARRRPLEDRLAVVLDLVGGHSGSILPGGATFSPTRRRSACRSTRRWRCGCARARSTSSSAKSRCWASIRRCGWRSPRIACAPRSSTDRRERARPRWLGSSQRRPARPSRSCRRSRRRCPTCGGCWRGRGTGSAAPASGRSSSWTRSTASTRRSRMRSCRPSKTG